MGWIENEAKSLRDSEQDETADLISGTLEAREQARWHDLVRGFERDVKEFKRMHGSADFTRSSDIECRITNSKAKAAVAVRVDLPGQTIRYDYEPVDDHTAVPESGILTMRPSKNRIELYSADQPLSLEQARKLILQPILFPDRPEDLPAAG